MSDGRLTAYFVLLAPAALCWLAGLLWLGPHVLLAVPSVLLLGYAFWLDATETLRRGRDAIIRYERAPVLSYVSRVDVRLAFLAQGLTGGALVGWMVPLLFGPHLWFWLVPGVSMFMSAAHVMGWRANRALRSQTDQTCV